MKRGGENQTFLERAVFSFRAENGSERKNARFFSSSIFSPSALSPRSFAQPVSHNPRDFARSPSLALARPPSPLRESLGSFLRALPPIPPGSRAPLVEERRGSHSPRELQRSPGLAAVLLPPSRLLLRNRRVSRAPRLPLFLRPLAFPSRRFPAAFATSFLSASRQCRAWKRQRPGHRKKRPPSCFLPPQKRKERGKTNVQPAGDEGLPLRARPRPPPPPPLVRLPGPAYDLRQRQGVERAVSVLGKGLGKKEKGAGVIRVFSFSSGVFFFPLFRL